MNKQKLLIKNVKEKKNCMPNNKLYRDIANAMIYSMILVHDDRSYKQLLKNVADALKKNDPKFDRKKFIDSCHFIKDSDA